MGSFFSLLNITQNAERDNSLAAVMRTGAILGSYFSAKIAKLANPRLVRNGFLVWAIILTGFAFWKYYEVPVLAALPHHQCAAKCHTPELICINGSDEIRVQPFSVCLCNPRRIPC